MIKTNTQSKVTQTLIIIGFLGSFWNILGTPAVAEDATPKLPIAVVKEDRAPRKTVTVVATAYNSVPGQTDDTPFIAANGKRVHPGMIAANFLPFGTYVKFPDLYGDRMFVVEDRMNARYGTGRVDLWMTEVPDARAFGVQKLKMEVY